MNVYDESAAALPGWMRAHRLKARISDSGERLALYNKLYYRLL